MLDLTSFEKALASLKRALDRCDAAVDDLELRDGAIQRFEYTYELCWKMLKRRLEELAPNRATVDAMGFNDLIREGAERGFVRDPEAWFAYRQRRNLTAHTYDEKEAARVFAAIRPFFEDAVRLLTALKKP